MNTQQTIPVSNTTLEKLRKHLILSNFHETPKTSQKTTASTQSVHQKAFTFDQIATDNILNAHLSITPSTGILNAWFIKLLDTFFSETLLIDSYVLKLNFSGCDKDQYLQERQRLLNTLQILSISYVIDQSSLIQNGKPNRLMFEFSCNSNILAHGSQQFIKQSNEFSMQAKIMLNALPKTNSNFAAPAKPALHLIVPQQDAQNDLALLVAAMLHHAGRCVDIQTTANSSNATSTPPAKYLLFLGDTEQKTGTVIIKNLADNTQVVVKQTEILTYI